MILSTTKATRELDAEIAEKVMGGFWIYCPDRRQRKLIFNWGNWQLEEYKPEEDMLTEPDEVRTVEPFSSDLQACDQAVKRLIEKGKGPAYARAMADQWDPEHNDLNLYLLTASAADRCWAMLTAVASRKK